MPYVQREGNIIVGVFAQPQPGFAEEELADDDKEVSVFRSEIEMTASRDFGAEFDALKSTLVAKGMITEADIAADSLTAKGTP